ncbi:MAG: class I SAM-dependent methyltransferase [Phycisphaerales bacterium]
MEAVVYEQIAELEDSHWWHVARQRIIGTVIERYGPPMLRDAAAPGAVRPRLCDIGCGAGALLRDMSARFDVTGVDSSPIARDLCARAGIRTTDGTLPDGLPLEPGRFDVVVVADVLEHVERDAASVRTLAGLLRPGGIIVATVPANPWMWSSHDEAAHHFRRYTRGTLRAIFEPGVNGAPGERLPLKRELLSSYNCFLFPPIALVRGVGRLMSPRGRAGGAGNAGGDGTEQSESDLARVPEPMNSILCGIFGLERHLLGRVPLPLGVSLIAVYRRV